ncbi:MAG: MarR family transcriptional regulator [Acholeplasmatales bacterium]|nr:MarR family transcriptional regulator [Acholeplasmatales bacterium]
MDDYNPLKLENQICFPLYACSKEIIKLYKPFLDELDLTYTQYITMMVMWEYKKITAHLLGEKLYLDSGTLTPMLKKLEGKGLIERARSKTDERNLDISITEKGMNLRQKAINVPNKLSNCIPLETDKALELYKTLNELLTLLKK